MEGPVWLPQQRDDEDEDDDDHDDDIGLQRVNVCSKADESQPSLTRDTNITRSSASAKSTARPSCLVGV